MIYIKRIKITTQYKKNTQAKVQRRFSFCYYKKSKKRWDTLGQKIISTITILFKINKR